jgi:NADH:ubiquinone oxidoreductase subunit E
MAKRKTDVPFRGTKEQEQELLEIIETYKGEPGPLMPVLQRAQEIYGYLPIEVQQIVATGLNLTLAEVYGVVTFYSQFTLNPKGQHVVNVCLGTACYVKGSQKILDKVQECLGIAAGGITADGKFSIDASRCVGACGLAPIMMVGAEVHGRITPEEVPKILARYQ